MDQGNTKQPKQTLDDAYKEREAEIRKVEAENPDIEPLPEQAWKSQVKISFDVENSLTPEKKAEMDAIIEMAFKSNFDPTVTKNALEEAKKCLAGHDDAIKQYDAIFALFKEEDAETYRNVIGGLSRKKST